MARVTDEWFRSPAWDEAARGDFERRLTAARPNVRAQYLRLKALSLLGTTALDDARDLLRRSLEEPGLSPVQRASALEQLARIALQDGDPALAEHHYRAVLAGEATDAASRLGTTGTVEIGLAELLIDSGDDASIDEAAGLLSGWIARSGLRQPAQLFRWNIALLRIAQADGDRDTARDVARTALALAAEGSLLPRQRGSERVVADAETLDRLRTLAV